MFQTICSQFRIKGEFESCTPYGEGHIHRTYLVRTREGAEEYNYILQGLHPTAFSNIPKLQDNIMRVTDFIKSKILEAGGDPEKETMSVIRTVKGNTYYFDGQMNYRMLTFIPNTMTFQSATVELFRESGWAFGNFAYLLSAFDCTTLYETIPNFHHTPCRLEALRRAISADICQRVEGVRKEIHFALSHAKLAPLIVDKLASGALPLRVTHNDTKLNNVLFDATTKKPVAVIDLDTVMAGSVCYDFGDAIRFGCNTAAEDETDLSLVQFSLPHFEAFCQGYLKGTQNTLTATEREMLPYGAMMMTYECGMRFLTDYLEGDVYFHTAYPTHNLVRARTQFKLLSEMEAHYDDMVHIVHQN